MSFLLESVEGGAVRGRYSIIGLEPDLIFRANGEHAEINRAPRTNPAAFAPVAEPPLAGAARLHRRKPHRAAGRAAADGGRRVRLSRLRHGAADGGHCRRQAPDPIGIPDAILVRPTMVIVFDAVKDTITVVTPVRPQAGVTAKAALARAVERLSAVVDALDRPLDKIGGGQRCRPARRGAALQHHAGRIQTHGAARQGLHRRRRYLPGRAVAAFRGAVHAAAVRALPGAAPGQSLALSVLPRFRRLSRSPARARKSWSRRATAPSPSVRSPAPGRAARRRTRTRRSKRSCWPIRRSAPSI